MSSICSTTSTRATSSTRSNHWTLRSTFCASRRSLKLSSCLAHACDCVMTKNKRSCGPGKDGAVVAEQVVWHFLILVLSHFQFLPFFSTHFHPQSLVIHTTPPCPLLKACSTFISLLHSAVPPLKRIPLYNSICLTLLRSVL